MNSSKISHLAWYAAGFVLSGAIFVVLLAWGGIYPFGDKSFLTEDLKFQYIDFFTWFKSVLNGQESLLYSFDQSLGSNTWGLFSYYLSSPFNLLIVFFDVENLAEFATVITALKVSCIQVTTMWYLRRRFDLPFSLAIVMALGFSWCLWVATQMRNPMWLDGLILLPLMLGMGHNYIVNGKWKLLLALMVIDIIACWYVAYMTILFLSLYLIVEMVIYASSTETKFAFVARRVGFFILICILALLLSAFTFLPTVLQMMGESQEARSTPFFVCSISNLLAGLSFGSWRLNVDPQLHSSTLVFILAIVYFMSPTRKPTERVAVLGLAVFMLCSSWIAPLQAMWCGFREPNGFYSRTGFLFAMTTLFAAGFSARDLLDKKTPSWALAVGGAVTLLIPVVAALKGTYSIAALPLAACVLVVLCTLLLLAILKGRSVVVQAATLGAVVVVVMAECLASAHLGWNQEYKNYYQSYHQQYVKEARAQVSAIESMDTGTYRIEKTYTRCGDAALNENLALGFMSLSSYSSAHNPATVRFLELLGYSHVGAMSVVYSSPILLSDSLLGVKYVSTGSDMAGYELVSDIPSCLGASVYQNARALSPGYASSSTVNDLVFSDEENPFERQNALVSAVLGREVKCYKELAATELESDGCNRAWSIECPDNAISYMYVDTHSKNAVWGDPFKVSIDGSAFTENDRWDHSIREIGNSGIHAVGVESLTAECSFYYLDLAELDNVLAEISRSQLSVSEIAGSELVGTINLDANGELLMTVPYDAAWTVTVNGEAAEPKSACEGAMMAISLPAGESQITMRYTPPGLIPGCIITAGTALALLALALARRVSKSKR